MNKDSNTHTKKQGLAALKKLAIFCAVILLLVNTIMLSKMGYIVESVDKYNKGVVDELGKVRSDIVTFGTDLNEIRKFLLLPTKTYSFNSTYTEGSTESDDENGQVGQAVYFYLNDFINQQSSSTNPQKAVERTNAIVADQDFINALKNESLVLSKVEDNPENISFKISSSVDNNAIFAVLTNKKTNETTVQSSLGVKKLETKTVKEATTDILSYVKQNKDNAATAKMKINGLKNTISNWVQDASVSEILKNKKATFSDTPDENNDSIAYSIKNSEGKELIKVAIKRADYSIEVQGQSYQDLAQAKSSFVSLLSQMDASTAQEKLLNDRKKEFEQVLSEKGLKDMLTSNNLTVVLPARNDFNKLLYDVKDNTGKVIFSFAIEISSGMYKVVKGDTEIDLYSFMNQSGTDSAGLKKKP